MDSTLAAYRGQAAWPELIHGRPAVVYPQQLAVTGARGSDGWATRDWRRAARTTGAVRGHQGAPSGACSP
ncbi:hypothetical protein ACIRST_42140 [Kitasatospora sp. NPDC101447]|uniref:hypothetical protein n=1 Tax=Kitasatospora sp. NPDC101447 TaxID=3364102 RepID=UPI0037F5FCA3